MARLYGNRDLGAFAAFASNATAGSDPLGTELGSMASRADPAVFAADAAGAGMLKLAAIAT